MTPHLSDWSPVQHYLVGTLGQLTLSLSGLPLLFTVTHSPSPPGSNLLHSLQLSVVVGEVVVLGSGPAVLLVDPGEAEDVVGGSLSRPRSGRGEHLHRGDGLRDRHTEGGGCQLGL